MSVCVISGVLFSDFAEIIRASESQGVKNKSNNGDILECKSESESEDALVIKLPYAGTNLTINLHLYPFEPWMAPDITFNDLHFASTITIKDLEDQVMLISYLTNYCYFIIIIIIWEAVV